MKNTTFLTILGVTACIPFQGKTANNKEGKPNLIYIMADQLRYDVLGYSGDKVAITPNIDKLATQSVNFTNAITCGPVSAAHRASLFTGKYVSSTGMVINELRINPNQKTLAHVLNEAGYETAYIGKWHLYGNCSDHDNDSCAFIPKGPYRLGFNGVWKAYNFHHNYMNAYYYEDEPVKISYGEGTFEPEIQFNQAMEYIDGAAKTDKPFALVLSVGIPHDPWTKENVPAKYYNMFQTQQFSLPASWSDTPDPLMDRNTDPKRWLNYWKKNLPEMKHIYYAMNTAIDEYLGKLMQQLDDLKLTENTIVVFSSDHGEMFGQNGRVFKMIFYDPAARVPLLIRYPKKLKAGLSDDICINTPDLMPTLLGLMKLPVPKGVEGMNLSQRIVNGRGEEPTMAFMQGMGHTYQWKDGHEWRAVRSKRYTYAQYLVNREELLFDNIADPLQINNLAEKPEFAGIKALMKEYMKHKMSELKDEFQPCSYYKKWVDDNRCIIAGAKGKF